MLSSSSLSSSPTSSSIISESITPRSASKSPEMLILNKDELDNTPSNKEDSSSLNECGDNCLRSNLINTQISLSTLSLNGISKRETIKKIILNLYNLNGNIAEQANVSSAMNGGSSSSISDDLNTIEDYLDMLPNGKSQKNSILLTWKKRYLKLTTGSLYVYEDKINTNGKLNALNVYNLMGGKVEYENNRVISLDDSRGNSIVLKCNDDKLFIKWKTAIDAQIIDRSQSLWMKPHILTKSNEKVIKLSIIIINYFITLI